MTRGSDVRALSGGGAGPSGPGASDRAAARHMSFSVDGWDPSYGASLELEGQLEESTARIDASVELPADRWRPIDPDAAGPLPEALLFVDGVRRVEAQIWIDGEALARRAGAGDAGPGEDLPGGAAWRADGRAVRVLRGGRGVLLRRGRAPGGLGAAPGPVLRRAARERHRHLGRRLPGAPRADQESRRAGHDRAFPVAAAQARRGRGGRGQSGPRRGRPALTGNAGSAAPSGHPAESTSDLLIVDGPLLGRQHLPRALGYIKSHHATYLPPDLNAVVGALTPGQRTPAFLMGTSWDRHSWYLRLPGPKGAPWSGVVRIECPATLPVEEVTRLAGLSQRCLGRFASAAYKDSRAPQNLYPIAGLERELRRRLGDPRLLYRALREAARRDAAPALAD